MARHISIPFFVDILTTDRPDEVAALAADPSLDRAPVGAGRLFNRLAAARAAGLLRVGTMPLPSGRERQDAERQAINADLSERLDADPDTLLAHLGPALDAAADYVAGSSTDEPGPLAATLCGQLFSESFQATDKVWAAAATLRDAIATRNPLRWLADTFSQRSAAAKSELSRALEGDLTAVHAVGVASHNLAESLKRMRDFRADTDDVAGVDPDRAVAMSLAAPETVLRQAPAPRETEAGAVRRGTLVMLEVEAARSRDMDNDTAFLGGSWSACPARKLIPAMLAEIWRRAAAR